MPLGDPLAASSLTQVASAGNIGATLEMIHLHVYAIYTIHIHIYILHVFTTCCSSVAKNRSGTLATAQGIGVIGCSSPAHPGYDLESSLIIYNILLLHNIYIYMLQRRSSRPPVDLWCVWIGANAGSWSRSLCKWC